MSDQRPPIPDPMAREVRQRCGFGCVICGNPIYQYDHIIDYSEVKGHTADNLTLLCYEHHGEKTKKLLPREQVISANKAPYNLRNGSSKPQLLHLNADTLEIKIGPTTFCSNLNISVPEVYPIVIEDRAFVSFTEEDGHTFLSLVILSIDSKPLLVIRKNVLEIFPITWDIEYVANHLTIREGAGEIIFKMAIAPPNKVSIERATFIYKGYKLIVTSDGYKTDPPKGFVAVHGKVMSVIGIFVGKMPPGGCGVHMQM